jgi:hypothetical protein
LDDDQRQAIEEALVREVPLFAVRLAAARAGRRVASPRTASAQREPASDPRPLPLPIWRGPGAAAAPAPSCPNCGEVARIDRIDLTANAGWLSCGACGLRWGGSIHAHDTRLALPAGSEEDENRGAGERDGVLSG